MPTCWDCPVRITGFEPVTSCLSSMYFLILFLPYQKTRKRFFYQLESFLFEWIMKLVFGLDSFSFCYFLF